MEFTCDCCHYSTTVKCNYGKHLSSTKHIKNMTKYTTAYKSAVSVVSASQPKDIPETPQTTPETTKVTPKVSGFFCKYCDNEFKHRSSLSKHTKYSCTKKKYEDEKEEPKEDVKELMKEFMKGVMKMIYLEVQMERKDLQIQLRHQQEAFGKKMVILMGKLEQIGS